VSVGDIILVVDVGGGTTDFSAIAASEREGSLELTRIAVGDHILLGGDNMDLALAHTLRLKLEGAGQPLDRWQLAALTHSCRDAKEQLLSDDTTLYPPRSHREVRSCWVEHFARSSRSEVTRAARWFLPRCRFRGVRLSSARRAHAGTSYASDAGVTRHLASFDVSARASGGGSDASTHGGPLQRRSDEEHAVARATDGNRRAHCG
jgi:hypothetical protein